MSNGQKITFGNTSASATGTQSGNKVCLDIAMAEDSNGPWTQINITATTTSAIETYEFLNGASTLGIYTLTYQDTTKAQLITVDRSWV